MAPKKEPLLAAVSASVPIWVCATPVSEGVDPASPTRESQAIIYGFVLYTPFPVCALCCEAGDYGGVETPFFQLPCPQSIVFQEPTMAVQQNKKSPSKRGMHRSHNALTVPGIAVEPTTGEVHLRHHISPTGFYRGRKVLKTKSES